MLLVWCQSIVLVIMVEKTHSVSHDLSGSVSSAVILCGQALEVPDNWCEATSKKRELYMQYSELKNGLLYFLYCSLTVGLNFWCGELTTTHKTALILNSTEDEIQPKKFYDLLKKKRTILYLTHKKSPSCIGAIESSDNMHLSHGSHVDQTEDKRIILILNIFGCNP